MVRRENAQPYKEVASQEMFALLLGNEGEGVNKALLNETTQNLTIRFMVKRKV